MLDTGYWMLDAGYWMLDAGYWMLDAGYWMLNAGYLPKPVDSLMKVKNKLTFTSTFGSVKRLPLPEYCPTPDEYLTRCGYQSQLLGFTATYQTFVEASQRVITTDSTKCSHVQEMSYFSVPLSGDPRPLADARATFIGECSSVGIWLRSYAQ